MKKKSFFLMLFFGLFAYESFFSQSAICSYSYRKRITFNPASVAGPIDLTNFPVIINLTSDNDLRTTANSGHVQNANGYDIVFTSDDGITLLNHQLMSYSATNGNVQCWVKIPNLSTSVNTNIYMYYGNSAISTDQSSTATWSNGYVGVWHFDNSLNNSTATSGLNGTNNGSTNTTTAVFGSARNYASASSQYIDVTPYTSAYDLTGSVTVSAWIRIASTGADQKILGNQDNTNGGWKFGVFSDNKIEFEIRTSGNASSLSRSVGGGTALGTGTWYYAVGQYSDAGDFINTYLNGSLDRSLSTTAVLGASAGTMKFGREPFSSGAFLNGIEDEVRLSNVIRSADWIATEYNNQNSPGPGTFYSISSEPNVFTGASSSNWNTAGNWSSGSVPTASTDVILTGVSNQPNLNTDINMASVWIRPSTTFNINNNRDLGILYDITNCGTMTGSNGNSIVEMLSTSAYAQTQYLSGSGTYSLRDLTINNTFSTNPMVVLGKDVDLANDLVLTSGIVSTTSTNIIALGTGATSTSGSAASFVSGPMSKAGTAAFVFPVGKGASWRRLGISAPTSSSVFRAEYFNSAHSSSTANTPLNNVSTIEYWQLDRLSGTGNASLTLYWESASGSGITNCPDLTIARYNGSGWDERVASTTGGSSCTGTGSGAVTTTAVVTAFSPFTFGSKLSTVNPLPVELIDFKAHCESGDIYFDWSTTAEIRNDYFSVQYSADGSEWQEVKQVKGAGNSSSLKNYNSVYEKGLNGYYRLVQVDDTKMREIFKTLYLDCLSDTEDTYNLFPNPSTGELNLQFDLSRKYEHVNLKVVDHMGRVCVQKKMNLIKGQSLHKIALGLQPGAYTVLISSDQLSLPAQKLIVR